MLSTTAANATADATSGLLALVNAAATTTTNNANDNDNVNANTSVHVVAVQRSSVVVSDISDDDDHDESGNASDAESFVAPPAPAASTPSTSTGAGTGTGTTMGTTIKRRGRPVGSASFPIALMTLLNNNDNKNSHHPVGASFEPDGHTFTIHDARAFSDQKTGPLKTQLRISSFRTFLRKLEQWGFVQLQVASPRAASIGGGDTYTFYHPSGRFSRSEPNMARTIRRASPRASAAQQHTRAASTFARSTCASSAKPTAPLSTTGPLPKSTCAVTSQSPLGSSSSSHQSYQHQLLFLEQRRIQLQLKLQRMAALDRSIRGGVRYSDVQVSAATRNVVGAAMMALQRDRAMYM